MPTIRPLTRRPARQPEALMRQAALALGLLMAGGMASAAASVSASSKSDREYGYFIQVPPRAAPIDETFRQCVGNVCYDNRVQAGTQAQAARNRIASRGYTITSAQSASGTLVGGRMSLLGPPSGAADTVPATVTLRLVGDTSITADASSVAWSGFELMLSAGQSFAMLSEYRSARLMPPDAVAHRMWRSGPDTVSATLDLPAGSFDWSVYLETRARGYTQLGQYSAQSAFSLSFIENRPVFDLPTGYSLWSEDLGIVDNQWCPGGCAPVPEPGTGAQLSLGLALLALAVRHCRRLARRIVPAAVGPCARGSAVPAGGGWRVKVIQEEAMTPSAPLSGNLPRQTGLMALGLLLASVAMAQTAPGPSSVVAFDEVQFPPVIAGPAGAMQAHVLWGQPASGPSAMYLKLGRVSLPLHLHSADYHLLVVQGTMKHWVRGEAEADARPLGPGSYWFQPGGQVHADACLSDSCLVFLVWSGPRDGRMAPPEPPR